MLEILAGLDDPTEESGDFEAWLRTNVKDKLRKYEVVELCWAMNKWRDRRNNLTHHLFSQKACDYDAEELRCLAIQGMDYAKRLDNISGAMARLMGRYEKRRAHR